MTNYREGACGPCNQGTLDVEDCQCPPPMTRDAQSGVEAVLAGVLAEADKRANMRSTLAGPPVWSVTIAELEDLLAAQTAALAPVIAAERAKAWDDAIREAEACGWLHDAAAADMIGRNPHRRADREQS